MADPVKLRGKEYVFERRTPPWAEEFDPYYLTDPVLGRFDDLDVLIALEEFEKDVEAAQRLLARGPSFEELVKIWINQHDWIVFLAHRHPSERLRRRYSFQVGIGHQQARRIVELIEKRGMSE